MERKKNKSVFFFLKIRILYICIFFFTKCFSLSFAMHRVSLISEHSSPPTFRIQRGLPERDGQMQCIGKSIYVMVCLIGQTIGKNIPHMSHVTYHMSCVPCHMSRVTCHLSLRPTATAANLPPANSPIIYSRLVHSRIVQSIFFTQQIIETPQKGQGLQAIGK